ncbi:MAG: LysE family translocator [Alphaproteobacteria bacterium]|nr:LysE family translocator [Alphaproteobacteria bacterium]
MPGLDLLIPFAIATAVFAYFPGPALLYTAAQTLARGRRAGFMAALGIHLGCYFHVVAAALGLSAILQYVPTLYIALKLAGAGYLIWLGIGMWRQRAAAGELMAPPEKSTRRALFESMAVELLNPKVALFFLAFLPQFVDPSAGLPVGIQFLVLGVIVNFAFTSADILTVVLADRAVLFLRRTGHGTRIVERLGGGVLIALGLRLALVRE